MTDTTDQWDRLLRLTELLLTEHVSTPEVSLRYMAMLADLENDRLVNGQCVLGMRRAPASKNRHHAVEGGLVAHLLQMWDLWVEMAHVIRAHAAIPCEMNNVFIWCAILHHDLNKVYKYSLTAADPWEVDYARDSLTGLLTDTHKSLFILGRHGIHLPLPLHCALITAEGGFSKTHPQAEPVISKVVYLLDELSANVVDRLQTNRFWDSKIGGINEIS